MNTRFSVALLLSAVLALPFVFAACEESHTESTKQGMFGETKHEETTVTRNPVTGDTSVEKSSSTTR